MSVNPSDVYRVYLVRHAHAGPAAPGMGDFDRPLDGRGRNEAAVVARQSGAFGVHPEKIVTSAAARCRQTADAFVDLLPDIVPALSEALYHASVDPYLRLIAQYDGTASLMIIGHNPTMEEFSEMLIGREAMATVFPHGFPTAGLLAISFERPMRAGPPEGKPDFLITPSFSKTF